MPDGTYQYTRDGTFQMDNQGRVVTAAGNPVQPTITVPQNSSGPHRQRAGPGLGHAAGLDHARTIIGQIGLTSFINKAGLLPVGSNLYQDTPSSGPPQDGIATAEGYGTITQGSLEQANVDVVSEMSDLIAAQRAYEMNAKVIWPPTRCCSPRPRCSAEGGLMMLRPLLLAGLFSPVFCSPQAPRSAGDEAIALAGAARQRQRRLRRGADRRRHRQCRRARRRSRSTARLTSAPRARCRWRRCSTRCARIR